MILFYRYYSPPYKWIRRCAGCSTEEQKKLKFLFDAHSTWFTDYIVTV